MRGRSVRPRKTLERSIGGLFSGCRKMWAISGLGANRAFTSTGTVGGGAVPSGASGKSKSKLAKVHTKEFSCSKMNSIRTQSSQ